MDFAISQYGLIIETCGANIIHPGKISGGQDRTYTFCGQNGRIVRLGDLTMSAEGEGSLNFERPLWNEISIEAKSLLRRLLERDTAQRIDTR